MRGTDTIWGEGAHKDICRVLIELLFLFAFLEFLDFVHKHTTYRHTR